MLMLEHDAKELLGGLGIAVPKGVLLDRPPAGPPPFYGPWLVKAQVPTGGRGKAGGIKIAASPEELKERLGHILGMKIKGHTVRECRVEEAVAAAREIYFSISIDAANACLKVLISTQGGMDVEEQASDALLATESPASAEGLKAAISVLTSRLPADLAGPAAEAGHRIAEAFLRCEATLIEINPLFVKEDGGWVAGDAKVIIDDNALTRQDQVRELLNRRADAYADTLFKLDRGFDFVILDREGEIGLVTTGAGLSMKLIDELVGLGVRPYNFNDIRTGQMRGDPGRLIHVLSNIAEGPKIRGVLVNIFAGITNLAEFADLLVKALEQVPQLRAPLVARLVGHGEDEAEALLKASGLPLMLERDLDRAVALVTGRAPEGAVANA